MLNGNKIVYLQPHPSKEITESDIDILARKHFETVLSSTLPDVGETEKVADSLLIVNYLAIQDSEIKEAVLPKIRNSRTIIINAPESEQTSRLLSLGHIRGFFLRGEKPDTFLAGIETIKGGGFHMPEPICAQLLRYYQSVLLRHTEPLFTNLTQREIEVLQYLKEGVSNNNLADQLFVSEHTVKSHLYKIFRKLKVKNRTQAIEWAHKFLP
ncbi:response regulator transcription factor [Vibrio hannami]|uniref:response regulator transcription factor n=1 Tax=Vibrio hannami TaxID=2717094 RepID=UPI00240FBC5C|nr:response regulator transcription factor [Vibrio hannami]MDG3084806.1 response regulator transcription factor [Vibrio hannami]